MQTLPVLTNPVDVLILSNGPGEVTTWVRPVVHALRQLPAGDRLRISVMLSPCPHAMGKEAEVVRSYPEVDRVQDSEHFWNFLLWGKTAESWSWHAQGVVLFLGGDQFFALAIAKRLGYRSVVYAEWDARWPRWIDAFGVMNEQVRQTLPQAYQAKAAVVGDLMVDVDATDSPVDPSAKPLIGLLPGSKATKLSQGVPLEVAIAVELHKTHPQCQFVLFLAPTVDLAQLQSYGQVKTNPLVSSMGNIEVEVVEKEGEEPYLLTATGLKIDICRQFPALTELKKLTFALTTVGANTAQLGALGIPMVILLPTQHTEALKHLDGLPGLIARIPWVGPQSTRLINYLIAKKKRLFAWPNLWAGREIVPELLGDLTPAGVASQLTPWLEHPEQLAQIRQQLQQVRGKSGAAIAMAELVMQQITAQQEQGGTNLTK
ncbi:lipid-A-disaccharide synthase [Synechocystis sp. FACHB-383]|uniref:lipid-A-disaccharide synthase n=1 Tax=Synechocystis sp. FACHB-383 TaxID=2692864 RepID=UPI001F5542D7|nr:lipid-A-disaccharide synthase [Synechocystis sp. FACHB-383]